MNEPKLGELITDPTAARDAIHIAIEPVMAVQTLFPGQRVGLRGFNKESGRYLVGDSDDLIGIVDPFLTLPVQRGQQCYLYLFPKTITSLRHSWSHPAFTAAHREK